MHTLLNDIHTLCVFTVYGGNGGGGGTQLYSIIINIIIIISSDGSSSNGEGTSIGDRGCQHT